MAGVDFETCSDVPMGKISALGRRRSGELLGNSTNCLTWILPRAGAVCMCLCVCVYVYGLSGTATVLQTVPTIGFPQ